MRANFGSTSGRHHKSLLLMLKTERLLINRYCKRLNMSTAPCRGSWLSRVAPMCFVVDWAKALSIY